MFPRSSPHVFHPPPFPPPRVSPINPGHTYYLRSDTRVTFGTFPSADSDPNDCSVDDASTNGDFPCCSLNIDASSPPAPNSSPHTAPVETWSLDPGSVCVLPIVPVACDAFDTVDRPFDTVDRLYGGAESDSEEVDYSQDNDDACVAAQRREEFKRSHPGTAEAQEIRGDNLSMTERCRQQRIHFWPVAIEVDGAITPSFLRFFKNVCNAAKNLTGQNLSSFKHYWSKRIACEIHQFNATVRQRHHML